MRPLLLLAAFSSTVPAAAQSGDSQVAAPFTSSRNPGELEQSLECLTQAIYYEARNQSADGQRAVAQVVLNRVRHPSYPNSVCGVVYQGSERTTGCQFTFTCDGSLFRGSIEPGAWNRAQEIARTALAGSVYRPVGLALNYHTTAIRPYWAPSLTRQAVIGDHVFYRRPNSDAESFAQSPGLEIAPVTAASARLPSAPVARSRGASAPRLGYEIPVMEISIVERPIRVQTVGAARANRPTTQRRAARPPASTRVTVESGVRVARGS
jgi:hypothetical protein